MCNKCKISNVVTRYLKPEEGDFQCMFVKNEKFCSKRATVLARTYSCEQHLCQEHMEQINQQLDEGVGQILRAAGLRESTDFVPIKGPIKCDETSLMNAGEIAKEAKEHGPTFENVANILSQKARLKHCNRRAMWAQMSVELDFLCPKHAALVYGEVDEQMQV